MWRDRHKQEDDADEGSRSCSMHASNACRTEVIDRRMIVKDSGEPSHAAFPQ